MTRRIASTLRLLGLALALAVVIGLVLPSCLAPTLPLPPPESPELVAQDEGSETAWDVAGTCVPGATVTVVNERTGRGAVIEDRAGAGRYRVTIDAEACDPASVKQEVDGELSSATSFVIVPTQDGDPVAGACP